MFAPEIKKAINLCISGNVPFVAYLLPKSGAVVFYSNPSVDGGSEDESVDISFFGKDPSDIVTVRKELDAKQTIEFLSVSTGMIQSDISPWPLSTSYIQYCAQVHQIVKRLKRYGGKIVLSRVLCGNIEGVDWVDVASAYFRYYPDTFRYIYYTSETGCWMGASPELLLEHFRDDDKFSTMSLAGTRGVEKNGMEWDGKNMEEHDYVTDYIVETLGRLGIDAEVSMAESLPYGCIEHLCHRIVASNPTMGISFRDVMWHLSPTPALSGYPVERALSYISEYEVHPRHCYGGFVAVNDAEGLHSYVNLRCVHFDKHSYCIYAGGGLTAKSVDEEEWRETESKVAVLADILTPYLKN